MNLNKGDEFLKAILMADMLWRVGLMEQSFNLDLGTQRWARSVVKS